MKRILLILMPAVLLGSLYMALVTYDDRFPYGRMRETPAVKPYGTPQWIMDPATVPVSGGEAVYRNANGRNLIPPKEFTGPDSIASGAVVYDTYCRQCHGAHYDGNGTVGQSFSPLPADLRSPSIRNLVPGVLFQHISYGIGPEGRQPALATTIRIEDRWKVIAFLKSLGPPP
jgi:mono/diheme cytochrome c family protein